jgi:hypothetical protein
MLNKEQVITKCAAETNWWIKERKKKLEKQLHETMSINPFILPALFELHNLTSITELSRLLLSSHLMIGHATGFGKLVDEKILPNVFGTQKLDSSFRSSNPPFKKSCFDEIDHVIARSNGTKELLSLKASKWTIQLTMAVQLNHSFNEIITNFPDVAERIVIGVFYGTDEELTDKYRIARGINTGKNHDVIDLTNKVFVNTGKEFWSWLNDGEVDTQNWVLEGVIKGVNEEGLGAKCAELIDGFEKAITSKLQFDKNDDVPDWSRILKKING